MGEQAAPAWPHPLLEGADGQARLWGLLVIQSRQNGGGQRIAHCPQLHAGAGQAHRGLLLCSEEAQVCRLALGLHTLWMLGAGAAAQRPQHLPSDQRRHRSCRQPSVVQVLRPAKARFRAP